MALLSVSDSVPGSVNAVGVVCRVDTSTVSGGHLAAEWDSGAHSGYCEGLVDFALGQRANVVPVAITSKTSVTLL